MRYLADKHDVDDGQIPHSKPKIFQQTFSHCHAKVLVHISINKYLIHVTAHFLAPSLSVVDLILYFPRLLQATRFHSMYFV